MTIRNSLQCFLHQVYDIDSGTVAAALPNAAKNNDCTKRVADLDQLKNESDEIVQEVLNDHDVSLWDDISPRDLLITLRTLAQFSK